MKRLNGWQRIGIIASVIWVLVGTVLTIKANSDEYDRQTGYGLDRCWKTADQAREQRFGSLDARHLPLGAELDAARKAIQDLMDKEYGGCADKVWANYPRPGLTSAITIPLITLCIAWLFVYLLVGLVRWVVSGFRKGNLAERRAVLWERTRLCPHCAEVIKPEAIVCRHCGRDIVSSKDAIDDFVAQAKGRTD